MSYSVAPQTGRSRPVTVTTASALLFLLGLIELVSSGLSVYTFTRISTGLGDDLTNQSETQVAITAAQIGGILAAVISVLIGISAVVLAILVGRGKQPARIVTWVLTGIGVLCYSCSLGGSALSSSIEGLGSTGVSPEAEALQQRIRDLVPAWQTVLTTVLSVVLVLACLATIILLALPVSNEYFRKEQEVWLPPSWPAAPGFPPMLPPPLPYGPPPGPSALPAEPVAPQAEPPAPPADPTGPPSVPPAPPAAPPAPPQQG